MQTLVLETNSTEIISFSSLLLSYESSRELTSSAKSTSIVRVKTKVADPDLLRPKSFFSGSGIRLELERVRVVHCALCSLRACEPKYMDIKNIADRQRKGCIGICL